MIWTGLGCLMQCINSIVWNKNMINRVPVYCDICKSVDPQSLERPLTLRHLTATRIQVALNVAIPACSLCINRRLYKIATVKAVMITREEKRRAVIQDLVICVGIPILQMVSGECAWSFTANESFTRMQSRVRCFVESLQHIGGFRPYIRYREYPTNLRPLTHVARDYRYGIFILLW
jgi:hypothetical protein